MISTQVMLLFVRLLPSLFPLSKNMNISFIRGKCVLREWATGVCPAMDWSLIHLIVRFVLSHYTSGASPFICSLRSSLYYHESYSDTEKVQGSVITRLCTKASRNFNALPPGLCEVSLVVWRARASTAQGQIDSIQPLQELSEGWSSYGLWWKQLESSRAFHHSGKELW